MFHTIYIVVCVARDCASGEIYSHTCPFNRKDIAEEVVNEHRRTWGKQIIYCGITTSSIFIR